jgi:hypothetical protein
LTNQLCACLALPSFVVFRLSFTPEERLLRDASLNAAWALVAFVAPAAIARAAGRLVPAIGSDGADALVVSLALGLAMVGSIIGPASHFGPRLAVTGGRYGAGIAAMLAAAAIVSAAGGAALGAVVARTPAGPELIGAGPAAHLGGHGAAALFPIAGMGLASSAAAAALLLPAVAAAGSRGLAAAVAILGPALGCGLAAIVAGLEPAATAPGASALGAVPVRAMLAPLAFALGPAAATTALVSAWLRLAPPVGPLDGGMARLDARRYGRASAVGFAVHTAAAVLLLAPATPWGRSAALFVALPAPALALLAATARTRGRDQHATPGSPLKEGSGAEGELLPLPTLIAVSAGAALAGLAFSSSEDGRLAAVAGAAAAALVLSAPALIEGLGLLPATSRRASP